MLNWYIPFAGLYGMYVHKNDRVGDDLFVNFYIFYCKSTGYCNV